MNRDKEHPKIHAHAHPLPRSQGGGRRRRRLKGGKPSSGFLEGRPGRTISIPGPLVSVTRSPLAPRASFRSLGARLAQGVNATTMNRDTRPIDSQRVYLALASCRRAVWGRRCGFG